MKNGTTKDVGNVLFVSAPEPGDQVITGPDADAWALEIDVAYNTSVGSVDYLEKKLAEYRERVARFGPERRTAERKICVRRPVKG